VVAGAIIGFINWPISIMRLRNETGPSGIPIVGAVLMILGLLLMPEKPYLLYIWLPLIIDFTCLPLLLYGIQKGSFK
jgi:hypothetical protein